MTNAFTLRFSQDLRVPLQHPLNGRRYTLLRADGVPFAPDQAAEVALVCNEPLVYDRLFRARRQGQAYTVEEGEEFLMWAAAGWLEGTHFVFLLLDAENRVVGALDIKSSELNAGEVGYRLSGEQRGIMTTALRAMIDAAHGAGFQRLWARPDADNLRSLALLQRAGFTAYCPADAEPGTAYFEREL